MKISDLSAERQAHLKDMRAIDEDNEGNEVLVGLTVEETSFYLNFQQRLLGDADPTDGERYLKLTISTRRHALMFLVRSISFVLKN